MSSINTVLGNPRETKKKVHSSAVSLARRALMLMHRHAGTAVWP